ncbi:hypothetical protein [Candidatus Amarolinea dominans]|uniref:hypothetical protein n=1 Tax=Candidatus Amarolinea dominans TaxID=3140696 RepID=UPI001DAF87D4|nr:hypothetical protein [Anaerolineae bacterium]
MPNSSTGTTSLVTPSSHAAPHLPARRRAPPSILLTVILLALATLGCSAGGALSLLPQRGHGHPNRHRLRRPHACADCHLYADALRAAHRHPNPNRADGDGDTHRHRHAHRDAGTATPTPTPLPWRNRWQRTPTHAAAPAPITPL